MLKIHENSHRDHNLTDAHVDFILSAFADKTGFFIATVRLPEHLPDLMTGLHGPVMGDAPVPESEVEYIVRGNRAGASRMTNRPPRPTRWVTVIGGQHGDEPCVLYTAYGSHDGPLAPREPWDTSIPEAERAASRDFWAVHALSRDA